MRMIRDPSPPTRQRYFMPFRLSIAIAMSAACLLAGGCAGQHPNFWHPGTVQQQRLRATVHDPFPDPDMGPKIDGGRPREFQDPLPEPVRNRIYADNPWSFRR
jgi:hypothetical protein